MKIPYKVTVKGKGNDVNVSVYPQPIATKDEYIEHVATRVKDVIIANSMQTNNFFTRQRLKNQMISVLEQLHAQGYIKPKED